MRILILILFITTSAVACGDPIGPLELIRPEIAEIRAEFSDSGDLLSVIATPVAPHFQATVDQRIPVLLTTDAGEKEQLLLYPRTCVASDGWEFDCSSFLITMRDEYSVLELRERIEALPAHMYRASVFEKWAAVRILGGHLDDAIRAAGEWPHVLAAEYNWYTYEADVGGRNLENDWRTSSRASAATPRAGDGEIQVGQASSVTVSYEQPDGSTQRFVLALPAED